MAQFANYYLNFYRDRKSPGKSCFLWPVWVWEILAPKPGKTRLNLFQRSILGLLNSQITDASQIAAWLGIEKDMVLYIIAGQLQPNGWLNSDFTLTKEGKQLLNTDVDVRSDLTTAYVFQDALSGQWWPRVAQELISVEPSNINARGIPEFARDKDSGWKDSPYMVPCPDPVPVTVEPEAMWQAVKAGNNAIYNQYVRDELEYDHKEFRADEIESIGNEPFKAYVLCWIKEDSVQQWTITDPLAVTRDGNFLRQAVFGAAQKNKGLANKLKDYIGDVKEDETLDEWSVRIQADAEFTLWVDFPGGEQIPYLENYLLSLLRREQNVKENGDKIWLSEDWEDLVSQCQKVFECCFKWMLDTWPLRNHKQIEKSWQNDDIYMALTAIAGQFISEEALQNLSRQKSGSIYHAAVSQDHNASLRPLLTASLFTLSGHTNHPLQMLIEDSQALDTILNLADSRNAVAHASGKKISLNEALNYADFTKKWIGTLLNLVK